ncbi:MAG: lysophospholipase [Alphaproteobacteria bacterium]|nr:lysophospholipase [Alphaproteobacteria bacterium]
MEHSTLSSADGTKLAIRRWEPADTPRAPILLVHGLAEHLGRYVHVAEAFTTAGYDVTGLELRGHGHSGGKRGHVNRWSDYSDDVRAAAASIGEPFFLVAHSMGGLVSLATLCEPMNPLCRGLVISNPLLGVAVQAPKIKELGGRLLSRILPSLSMTNEIPTEHLSRDPEVVRRYEEDPLVYSTITPRWYTEMLKAQEAVFAHASAYRLPVLLLVGEADKLCSPEASLRFFDQLGAPDKTLKRYPGYYHELFNEPEKAEILAEVVAWLDQHLGGDDGETAG